MRTSSGPGLPSATEMAGVEAALHQDTNDSSIWYWNGVAWVQVRSSSGVETGGIANGAVTLAKMADVATDRLIGRDTAGTGAPEALTVGGGVEFTGSGGIQRSALTGDVTASAGSGSTTIANDVVTYAKMQNVSATDRLLGRDTAAAGDVEELTVGGGIEFTGSGGIQRSALTGDVTASAGDVATTIANNAVTFAKFQQVASKRLVGRQASGTGNIEELSAKGPLEINPSAAELRFKPHTDLGLLTTDTAGDVTWKGPANYPCYPLWKNSSTDLSHPKISGTTFPTSPVDGQVFTHTTHRTMYYYDATAAGWLSTNIYEFNFGNSADLAATAFCEFDELAAYQTYSSTIGWLIGCDVKVVGICLNMAASGTCDVQVFDDGAAVTGAVLSLSSEQSKADEVLMSDTIAASSIVNVKVTSGTAEGPFRGKVRLRRFET